MQDTLNNCSEKQDCFFWITMFYLFQDIVGPQNVYTFLINIRIQFFTMVLILGAAIFQNQRKMYFCKENIYILLLLLSYFLSTLFAVNFEESWIVFYDYFKLVVLYFIIIYCINNENYLKSYLILFFLFLALYVMLSFREYLAGQHVYDMGVRRMFGWDNRLGPNKYGTLCAITIPIALLMFKDDIYTKLYLFGKNIMPQKLLKNIACFTIVISIVCIFLTNSRTSLLLLILYSIILIFKTKKKKFIFILFILIIPMAINYLPDESKHRYLTIIYDMGIIEREGEMSKVDQWTEASSQGRLYGLIKGLKIFVEHPLVGVGPGGFQYVSGSNIQAHNLLGQIASETGTFGIVIFTSLLWFSYKNFKKGNDLKNYHVNVFWKETKATMQDIFVLLLFCSIFAHTLYFSWWLYLFSFGVLGKKFSIIKSSSK